MIEMFVECRFLGGPWDGRVRTMSESVLMGLGVLRVPEPEPIHVAVAYGQALEDRGPVIHTYTWDRTVNERGERRMRWDGQP